MASATLAVNVLGWWGDTGQSLATKLGNDMDQVGTDAQNENAVVGDCTQVESDVSAAQSATPIPDATLEALWSEALTDYSDSCSDMTSGIENNDVTVIDQADSEITNGNTAAQQLVNAIKAMKL